MTKFALTLLRTAAAIAPALLAPSLLAPPALAQTPPSPTAAAAPAPKSPFVPADFVVPTRVDTADFRLVPLGPDVVQRDYDAYMSSIAHLQTSFSRSTNWPRADISRADAMRDMQNEQARFTSRRSFAFAVLTPDGSRERGSVYVSPSPVGDHDAVVRLWVTKADYDAGFDARLYAWVTDWIRTDWPFRNPVYPGRSIAWSDWDRMVAATRPAQAAPPPPAKAH